MRSLNDTIRRLGALRELTPAMPARQGDDRLADLTGFGSNPGALRARYHVPGELRADAALVVVLHGCTQSAAGYDHGSGWSRLADEHGFAVLFPEQQRANNANLCFNWFSPEDVRRGSGEALSIRQMVAAMIAAHGLDASRVYVTGLSAGGAMASTLLAAYPDVFAGGAIIAGLPFGTARSVPEAFDRMRGHGGPAGGALGALVSAASEHGGPWPTVSVWHGGSDATVAPVNAGLIVEQWRGLHGVPAEPTVSDVVDGHAHQTWRNAEGRTVIEEYRIAGMAHGTPLHTAGSDGCGVAGPYMLEAGISSTRRIAAFWGLLQGEPMQRPQTGDTRQEGATPAIARELAQAPERSENSGTAEHGLGKRSGVTQVIEDALRAAGLMR
ncbi:alpha/beta hydrolase family esterase [Sphingomonas sp. S2-65]|uniref:extracellular catalytic domain type 1 short-chain-length polyhydroxyalkanoate depolymerase n=1 Tax=Sphingomonas sp. S2-65 TaxID=2903960 RepID=UPI001F44D45D|nr:PHB depolymerase family esterase [Sphingomonas sp. S2-65]UYY58180.1 PHB depolymerase family esterase [Sphingomonas sp. S2-65]